MAAIDTFDWLVEQFWPHPDESTRRQLRQQRAYLLNLRNENERLLFIQELMDQAHEQQERSRQRPSSKGTAGKA